MSATDSKSATHGLLDAEERVRVSLPCLDCQYDLRTLEVAGCCPECGTPVRQSIDVYSRHRPDLWLPSLHTGMTLMSCGAGLIFAPLGLVPVLAMTAPIAAGAVENSGLALVALGLFVQLTAAWLLTFDPPTAGPAAGSTRTPARLSLWTTLTIAGIAWLGAMTGSRSAFVFGGIGFCIGRYVTLVLLTDYVRKLPQAIDQPAISSYGWLTIVLITTSVPVLGVFAMRINAPDPDMHDIVTMLIIAGLNEAAVCFYFGRAAFRMRRLANIVRRSLDDAHTRAPKRET